MCIGGGLVAGFVLDCDVAASPRAMDKSSIVGSVDVRCCSA